MVQAVGERNGLAVTDVEGASRARRRRAANAWGWRLFLAIVMLALFGPLLILVLFSFNDLPSMQALGLYREEGYGENAGRQQVAH